MYSTKNKMATHEVSYIKVSRSFCSYAEQNDKKKIKCLNNDLRNSNVYMKKC